MPVISANSCSGALREGCSLRWGSGTARTSLLGEARKGEERGRQSPRGPRVPRERRQNEPKLSRYPWRGTKECEAFV